MTSTGPVRYSILVVMDLTSRHVEVAGIVREAYEQWMVQVLRNLTDAVDGFLLGKTHLIMDRDPIFSAGVRDMLRDAGANPIRLPRRSPNLNDFIERLIREYMLHYHVERPNQGLDGALIRPAIFHAADGPLVRRKRLGGLLNYYYREAA